ncbi:GSCFA domain-containing protein [Polaribacter sp. SA4-10]|uniref:GSCFA domain-containing protein n=1 Tax=Polaribacter sp. SA4-10 TaxID=754397 RepID=UPI000B3BEB09|nr:GSCFA domain-containing protein [Polaribacter sp. SA4-10]ARV07533.1 GSCFA domain-containing protein [Polaribacter sp. SA4-10]
MQLQTKIPLKKETRNLIDYNSKLLLLGSCFSENIGNKLNHFKFQTNQNPFGILFHPKAIESLITNAINKKVYTATDLVFQNERWHCFDAHSNLSAVDKNELLNNLNTAISSTNNQLQEASHIIITLGTSWVYRFIETDKVVANCHKIPQKKFLKELLSVDEITQILEAIISLLKAVNKDVNVLFTVSPIRHLKDGFIENTQSKSHLIAGIHNVIDKKNNTFYFPSYEIMMDELRDYRFYAEDMIHPSKTAINYIWERFIFSWFSSESLTTMQEIETIQKGISHRPFNKNSEKHQQFLNNLEIKKEKITQQFSFISF